MMNRKIRIVCLLGIPLSLFIVLGSIVSKAHAGEKNKDKIDSFLDGVTDKVINATSSDASEADKNVTREVVKGAFDPRSSESNRHQRETNKAIKESVGETSEPSRGGSSDQSNGQGSQSAPSYSRTNLATQASVNASSVLSPDYRPSNALDSDLSSSWLARQSTGEWLELSWPDAISISRVVVYNRCKYGGSYDPINSASLQFSDGSRLTVPGMKGYLERQEITFPFKSVTWIRFSIDQAPGQYSNGGLAEIEVYSK
jgi:hypothetical protein